MTPAIKERIHKLAKVDAKLNTNSHDIFKVFSEIEAAEYTKALAEAEKELHK